MTMIHNEDEAARDDAQAEQSIAETSTQISPGGANSRREQTTTTLLPIHNPGMRWHTPPHISHHTIRSSTSGSLSTEDLGDSSISNYTSNMMKPYLTVPPSLRSSRNRMQYPGHGTKPNREGDTSPGLGHAILPTFGKQLKNIRGFPSIALRTLCSSQLHVPETGKKMRSKSLAATNEDHKDLKHMQVASTIPSLFLPPVADSDVDVSDVVTIPSSYMLPSVHFESSDVGTNASHDAPPTSRRSSLNLPPIDMHPKHRSKNVAMERGEKEQESEDEGRDDQADADDERKRQNGSEDDHDVNENIYDKTSDVFRYTGKGRRGSSVSVLAEQYQNDRDRRRSSLSHDKPSAGPMELSREPLPPLTDKESSTSTAQDRKSNSSLLIYHCQGTPEDRRFSLPIVVDAAKKKSIHSSETYAKPLLEEEVKQTVPGFVDPLVKAREAFSNVLPVESPLYNLTESILQLDKIKEDALSIWDEFKLTPLTLQRLTLFGTRGHKIKRKPTRNMIPICGELGEFGFHGTLTEDKLEFIQDWLVELEGCRAAGDMDGEIVTEEELSWTYELTS